MAVENDPFFEKWPGVGRTQECVEDGKRGEVIHHLVGPREQPGGSQNRTLDAVGKVVGEPHLRRSAQRAIGHAEVASAEGVVDHLADFHDPPRVRPRFAIDDHTEHDVVRVEPRGVRRRLHGRVVDRGDAVAEALGLAKRL